MIRSTVERTIVVQDSEPGDESTFTIYVRDAVDVEEDGTGRHVMMPESVWLTLDDTEQLGHALVQLAQDVRAEREAHAPKPPAKRAAPRKRAAKKTTGAPK